MEPEEKKDDLAPVIAPQPDDVTEIRRRRIIQLTEQSIQRQKRLALSRKRFHR
jgi:hypothetical protein